MATEKVVYKEKYGTPRMLKGDKVPELKHLNAGFSCSEAYMLEAGVVDRNGKEQEYQIIKVYIDE